MLVSLLTQVNLFYQLPFMVLCFARRLQQASSVDDQGKDKDASFRDDSVEVLTAFHCNYIQLLGLL